MNAKETKLRIKAWCNEHEDALYLVECVAVGAVIGVCFGKAMGNVIAKGYDRTYAAAVQNGYDKGRSDAIALMIRDNNSNSEVTAALADHIVKYCRDR